MTRIRYQIRFAKTDLLRWTSHRDLASLWERLVRRVGLQPSMTEGFHPKPRIGFPSALALGIEGWDEVVELDLAEEPTPAELLRRLQDDRQPGLEIRRVGRVAAGEGKAQLLRSHYRLAIPPTMPTSRVTAAIERLWNQGTIVVPRKKKELRAEVATQVLDLAVRDGQLAMTLAASRQAALKPTDLLSAMGLNELLDAGACLIRTRVELEKEIASEHCALAQPLSTKRTLHEQENADQCRSAGRESYCDSR